MAPYKALRGFRALEGPSGSYKASEDPNKASTELYKALKGLSRPLGPYKAHKALMKPMRSV